MSQIEDFLTAGEEAEVIEAIVQAERNTSGEIRIHLEATTKLEPYKRAQEIFHLLKMDNTKEDNGVLIYVAVEDKKFTICGDKGIHKAVPKDFWDSTKGQFKQGLVAGILKAGQELKKHFPWQHEDTNELSNEISKG
mgnify:CR=1 FL=1